MSHILTATLSVNRVLIPLIIGLDYLLPWEPLGLLQGVRLSQPASPDSVNLAKVSEASQLYVHQQHHGAEDQSSPV